MRTFIAIELPESARRAVDARRRALMDCVQRAGVTRGVRWVSVDKLHLTLRFLGDTSAAQLRMLAQQLPVVAAEHAPFTLALDELGCFPHCRRPSVVWLGIQDPGGALLPLQQAVEQVAQAAGFDAEARAFAPHLTLARIERQMPTAQRHALTAGLQEFAAARSTAPAGSFAVTSFVHIESKLNPSGARYTTLAEYSLGDSKEVDTGEVSV